FGAAAVRTLVAVLFLVLGFDLIHDVLDEIILFLFDARTHFIADETHNFRAGLLHQLLDRGIGILGERLAHQRDLGQILAQAALDHLGDDIGGLLLALGLLGQDLTLLVQHRRRYLAGIDIGGVRGDDVHGQIARQGLIPALEGDQAADAAAMNIGAEGPRSTDFDESAHRNVLPVFATNVQRSCSKLPAPFDDSSNASRVSGELAKAALASSCANAWNSSL